MQFATFYQTVAQLCFTLLGLWWLVLQTKYHEWIGEPTRRRSITNISLFFLLPGSMSLLALLSAQQHLVWQAAFFVASAIGASETGALLGRERTSRRSASARNWPATGLRLAGLALYVVIAVSALVAFIPGAAGYFNVDPLAVSGVLITLLVVSGVLLAWLYFIEPADDMSASAAVPVRQRDVREG
jgi:hypothetical protein